ncbi:MAG: 50S ribosomal protein L35 [Rhodospirillaceae bacterium]|nr:50S ribosomal protein L35 [Rhodospirillaceae bacterium]MDE0703018.1 50S ribosomal protein L35 [Rhodospirillaceae bacterium]MXW91114.1 50S ribosomal protein L35 [Rhodospirillaceae bacterium]MYB11823.1 50S ribosomal protein L35 [Rhodospirillaceae bacterium]MYG53642.1 50S ribosomal protein L35 [Rhodospirillaceae bacterium]
MPKLKTKSSVKKRFKLTGSGKIKRNFAFRSHNLTKRSTTMKRTNRGSTILDKSNEKTIRPMMPYAK